MDQPPTALNKLISNLYILWRGLLAVAYLVTATLVCADCLFNFLETEFRVRITLALVLCIWIRVFRKQPCPVKHGVN